MIKKIFLAIALVASFSATDSFASSVNPNHSNCMAYAPNDGYFSRTGSSVSVVSENGNPKGTFAVYLHKGRRYINFFNTWICIQGVNRFSYNGNWYVIR